jgi:hypothetical protein
MGGLSSKTRLPSLDDSSMIDYRTPTQKRVTSLFEAIHHDNATNVQLLIDQGISYLSLHDQS